MPELPDVEGYRRLLEHHVVGQRIIAIEVRDEGVIRGCSGEDFARRLKGRTFGDPGRRGKWLLVPTDVPTILVHFGMSGALFWLPASAGSTEARSRFDRVVFALDSGHLHYRDQRKLQGLWLAEGDGEIAKVIGDQGPDALGLTLSHLSDRLDGHRGSLKSVLMDQSVLAGLGNMLSDEMLWRAHIHPRHTFKDLSATQRGQLARAIQQVLRASVKEGEIPRRTSWLSSQRASDSPHCPRCHCPLHRDRIGGRTSYWCPSCQSDDSKTDG